MSPYHEVLEVLTKYFDGMYNGDVVLLRSIFHPNAVLFSVVKGQPGYKDANSWLGAVATRKSPKDSGETLASKALSIDVTGDIAFAKVQCPMLGFNYNDYLTLNKIDGKWLIVTKTFTHLDV